jgi:hypothetical protein
MHRPVRSTPLALLLRVPAKLKSPSRCQHVAHARRPARLERSLFAPPWRSAASRAPEPAARRTARPSPRASARPARCRVRSTVLEAPRLKSNASCAKSTFVAGPQADVEVDRRRKDARRLTPKPGRARRHRRAFTTTNGKSTVSGQRRAASSQRNVLVRTDAGLSCLALMKLTCTLPDTHTGCFENSGGVGHGREAATVNAT